MKRNIIIVSALTVLLLAIIASCSFITPAPDFELFHNPIGWYVSSTTTQIPIDSILVVNTGQVDMYVINIDHEFRHNGTILYSYDDNENDYRLYCPAVSDSMQAENDSSYVIIYGSKYEFPASVWTAMDNNDWSEINMRVYITAEDAYGYGKATTKYFDYNLLR